MAIKHLAGTEETSQQALSQLRNDNSNFFSV